MAAQGTTLLRLLRLVKTYPVHGKQRTREIGFSKVFIPKPDITKAEFKVIHYLKNDKSRIFLTVDKGEAMVFMDREEYIHKVQH